MPVLVLIPTNSAVCFKPAHTFFCSQAWTSSSSGMGTLNLITQWITHTFIYYLFISLMHRRQQGIPRLACISKLIHICRLRSRAESFCIHGTTRFVEHPSRLSWRLLTWTMQHLQALHYMVGDPELFVLPSTIHYNLDMDFNHR